MLKYVKYVFILILLCVTSYGCNTDKKTEQPPAPVPLIKYSSRSESVIIKAEMNRSNLPVRQVVLSNITDFCLYGNKTLIYRVEGGKKEIYDSPETINYPIMKKTTLQEKNVQDLLKFIIEEKKFFTVKKQKKEKKNISYSLTVNIEKSGRTVSFYSNDSKELKDVYNLLKDYTAGASELYRPQKISLTVYNIPDYIEHCTRKATIWKYKDTVNLEKLSGKYVPEDIQGKKLDNLLDFLTKYSPNEYFYFQGEKVYGIFCRPCLPHEIVNK